MTCSNKSKFIYFQIVARLTAPLRCQAQQDQITGLLEEFETVRLESEESIKFSRSLERENKRLKTLSGDLGRQVKVLLKEVEEARGGVASTSHDWSHDLSSDDVTSSSQVHVRVITIYGSYNFFIDRLIFIA